VLTDWFYEPSTALGGDAFSYYRLDDGRVVAYLVDVSGHGVGAAMHSVSIMNMLRQRALPATDFARPAEVLASLNAMFPMENHDGMYFTIWYGVYSVADRLLEFASAGHHPSYLFAPGTAPQPLRTRGPMIGAMPEVRYQTGSVPVPPGAVLYLFSDGAFEIVTPEGAAGSLAEFLQLLGSGGTDISGETERIYRAVRARAKPGPLDDDFSLLAIKFA
jgi:serine phosphatase RsbU (regulator of sigma subunit)